MNTEIPRKEFPLLVNIFLHFTVILVPDTNFDFTVVICTNIRYNQELTNAIDFLCQLYYWHKFSRILAIIEKSIFSMGYRWLFFKLIFAIKSQVIIFCYKNLN